MASSDPASAHPGTTTAANIAVTATSPRYTRLSMCVMMRVPVGQGTGITEPAGLGVRIPGANLSPVRAGRRVRMRPRVSGSGTRPRASVMVVMPGRMDLTWAETSSAMAESGDAGE
jgi:hypothetical protein